MAPPAADRSAGVVIACSDPASVIDFLTETVGFRVESIFPADAPRYCTLIGFGCRLHLEPGTPSPHVVRIESDEEAGRILHGPSDVSVQFVAREHPLVLPELTSSFSLTHDDSPEAWHTGRAGMQYRDLVPDRQGGAVIASHIRIPEAGPVPDYVHFHDIGFQLIFCRRGSVTVVYEDQGDPILLTAGDCVTQPPRIRHRVLDSSDGLEVIEIGYPAEHITRADPSTHLPTATIDPTRTWDGQVFVHHRRDTSLPTLDSGSVRITDTGIGHGTKGLADVEVIELDSTTWTSPVSGEREFVLLVVLDGSAHVHIDGPTEHGVHSVSDGSAVVVPVQHTAACTSHSAVTLLMVRIRTV